MILVLFNLILLTALGWAVYWSFWTIEPVTVWHIILLTCYLVGCGYSPDTSVPLEMARQRFRFNLMITLAALVAALGLRFS